MNTYFICIDPDDIQDYADLRKELISMRAREVLRSSWRYRTGGTSCTEIFNRLSGFIGQDESLLVIEQDICVGSMKVINPIKPIL